MKTMEKKKEQAKKANDDKWKQKNDEIKNSMKKKWTHRKYSKKKINGEKIYIWTWSKVERKKKNKPKHLWKMYIIVEEQFCVCMRLIPCVSVYTSILYNTFLHFWLLYVHAVQRSSWKFVPNTYFKHPYNIRIRERERYYIHFYFYYILLLHAFFFIFFGIAFRHTTAKKKKLRRRRRREKWRKEHKKLKPLNFWIKKKQQQQIQM